MLMVISGNASVLLMFQTDSDEDVIFVYEKSAPKSSEITIDQVVICIWHSALNQNNMCLSIGTTMQKTNIVWKPICS